MGPEEWVRNYSQAEWRELGLKPWSPDSNFAPIEPSIGLIEWEAGVVSLNQLDQVEFTGAFSPYGE